MADLTTRLGPLTLANPFIASSSELTMTAAGIRACVDAGVGAVVAKSINESPAAAAQLDIADYMLVDQDLHAVEWSTADRSASLFNRSGLAGGSLNSWVAMLQAANSYAESRGSLVIGSITVAEAEGAATLAQRLSEVVPAIELNVGAPHGREARAVRQVTAAAEVGRYVETVRARIECARSSSSSPAKVETSWSSHSRRWRRGPMSSRW